MKRHSIKPAPEYIMSDVHVIKKAVFPQTPHEWKALGRLVREEADKEDVVTIEDIPLALGYSPTRFKKWVKHDADFAEAYEYALYKIGRRREALAHANKMDRNIVMKTMPLYNYEYRDFVLAKFIQSTQDGKGAVLNIIMNKAPETDIVKPLPTREDT